MPETENNRRCERCRGEFKCGAAEGTCWCFGIAVTPDARIEIGKNFADCLCENCLRTFADYQDPDS